MQLSGISHRAGQSGWGYIRGIRWSGDVNYGAFLPVVVLFFIALCAPVLTGFNPERSDPAHALEGPNALHWLGTTNSGADVLSRVLYAARLDLFIALFSVCTGFAIGVVVGGVVGASTSWWSGTILRGMEFVQSFPVFILALAFVAMRGPSVSNVIIVIGALNVPIFVRLVRAEILSISGSVFIEAARCAGNGQIGLVFRHFLPNAVGPAVAQFSANVGWALLLASGLSFIGAGVQRPAAEWGLDIADGAENIVSGQWWVAGFPGLALGLAVLSFALAGDAIRDARDIKRVNT